MKNLLILVMVFLVLSFNFVSAQSDIEFVSPNWGTTLTGNTHADYVPVTITYTSETCTTPVCRGIDHITLLVENTTTNTSTTYTYYEEGEHSVTLNLEAGEYECTIVQWEEYYFNGSTLVSESDRDNLEFKVKYKIEIKTNVGGVIKYAETVSFLTKPSGYTPEVLIGDNSGMEAPDQERYGSYYVWKTSSSKWIQTKLNSIETDVSTNRRYYHQIASDDNKSVFEAYLRYDEEPPAIPQNVAVQWSGDHPLVSWAANTEPDLSSYKVAKRVVGETGWATVATVSENTTSWTDTNVDPAGKFDPTYTIEYKVLANDINGNSSSYSSATSITGTTNYLWKQSIEHENKENIAFQLFSNYPNPFNPKTQISYQIPNDGLVSLVVYNSLGEEVGQLVNQYQSKGQYSASFNASKLPSSVYIYKLQFGEFSSTKKMLLTK